MNVFPRSFIYLLQDRKNFNTEFNKLAKLFPDEKLVIHKSTTLEAEKISSYINSISLKFFADWKILVNKNIMSDITIYTKNEQNIYAHKLVLYVRCRSILQDTIKEVENDNKCTEIIMWMEYNYKAAIAFLEYIYGAVAPDVKKLNDNEMEHLKNLCLRYNLVELKNLIDDIYTKDKIVKLECENNNGSSLNTSKLPTFYNNNNTSSSADISQSTWPLNEGEENLLLLQKELQTQKTENTSSEILFECETSSTDSEINEKNEMVNPYREKLAMNKFGYEQEFELFRSTENSIHNEANFEINTSILSTDKSIVDINSNRSSMSKSFTEDIISMLCSPTDFNTSEMNVEINENSNIPECRLSSISCNLVQSNIKLNDTCIDNSITNNFKLDSDVSKKLEKRKLFSPLEKNTTKKSKNGCSKSELNHVLPNKLFTAENEKLKSRKQVKTKKTLQSYSLSDSSISSDCSNSSDSDFPSYKFHEKLDKELNSSFEFCPKSDTVVTPIKNCVTPMVDYSNLKSSDLKVNI